MNILVVEDEPSVAALIYKGLGESGNTVSVAPDGRTAWDMIAKSSFDVILLDVMLPSISGLELCRMIRKAGITTPVLMLTALGTTENIVTGLDCGADDYMIKPFRFAELEARIRSLHRRSQGNLQPTEKLTAGDLEMNLAAKTVQRNGTSIQLTATEFRLLECLLRNKGKVIPRLDLLEKVWGIDFNIATNVVDVYVNYLRKKIDKDFSPKLIHTVVGMGYIIREE
jgi:two-component system, OmpR family, copper resistance phosphate regulon response regulator CusR